MRRTVAALLMLSPLSFASSASAGAMTYLSLGDSIAFGETDYAHNPSGGDRGFVSLYDKYLAGRNGGVKPTVVNLAIDGETSSSLMNGTGRVPYAADVTDPQLAALNTHYAANPALSQNVRFIQTIGSQLAKGNTIGNVTISLGSNDLFALATAPGFLTETPSAQQAELTAALGKFASNYASLLTEVKALLPNAQVSLLGAYNPFPADPSSPFTPVAAPAIQALNATIAGLAQQFGANYVDTYSAFVGHEADYTYLTQIPGDDHPNALGYAAIAAQVEAVPEPATVAVLGLGFAGLALHARGRRSRASA